MTKTIDEYVKALPEIYQKIWRHPEYDDTSRLCQDRAEHIVTVVKDLRKKLGKENLRVLDLGCAQGYFCFTLKELGCDVDGIDFCPQNIELCGALNEEVDFRCNFRQEKLTKEFVESLAVGEYDVVLCLSVIHHVANENGFDYARGIFEELSQKAQVVITELAVKEEPLYWNENLPAKYESWFDSIPFFNELAFFPTHLSDIVRPLILFSAKYFYCEKQFFEFFEWKKKAYDIKPEDNLRRYYMGDSVLMKFCHSREYFVNEVYNEVNFLKENSALDFVPKVLAFEQNQKGVLAVYKINRGKLLIDLMKDGENVDCEKILCDILEQCAELENLGYYHGDLRLWNICVKDGRAFLIDFGNIQKDKQDLVAKDFNKNFDYSVYDAFLGLAFDLLTAKKYELIKDYGLYNVTAYFDFSALDQNFADFFKSCLILPKEDVCFNKFLQVYNETVLSQSKKEFSERQDAKLNLELLKRGLSQKTDYVAFRKNEIDVQRSFDRLQERCSAQECRLSEQEKQINAQDARLSEQARLIADLRAQLEATQARLESTYNLLVNTRHRTLYGALAWLWHKLFKRKG